MAGSRASMKTAQIRAFSGLNRRSGAGDGELTFTQNLTTDEYPALSTRAPMRSYGGVKSTVTGEDGSETEALTPFENASDVFECDGSIFVVQDGALFRDGVKIADVFGGKKQWGLVGGKLVIWPDRKYVNLHSGDVVSIEKDVSGDGTMKSSSLDGRIRVSLTGQRVHKTASYEVYIKKSVEVGVSVTVLDYRAPCMWFYRSISRLSDGSLSVTADKKWGCPMSYQDHPLKTDYMYFLGDEYRPTFDSTPQKELTGETSYCVVENVSWSKYRNNIYDQMYHYSPGTSLDGQLASYTEETWWTETYEYYTSITERSNLSSLFEEGDTVTIEGCSLLANNRTIHVLSAADDYIETDSPLYLNAYFFTASGTLNPGTYSIVCGNSTLKFRTDKRITAGQQIFAAAETVYLYDPETEVLTKMDASTDSAKATLASTAYDASAAEQITIKRECPDMEFICAHNNRLFGVSNREEGKVWNSLTGKVETVKSRVLHASELGFPTRWNSYNGNAMDSYSVAIGGSGDFTGICEYGGAVLLFKEDKLYRLTGDYPAEYYLRDYSLDGVKQGCHRSLCCINEVLYYLSPRGVMAYSGGAPSLISYKLGMISAEEASAGRDRSTYYLAVRETAGSSALFRYDTIHGLWMQQDETRVDAVCRMGDRALLLTGGALRITEEQSGEAVTWDAVLAETDEGTFDTKVYDQILLDAELGENAWLQLWIRMDGAQEWTLLNTVTTQDTARWHRLEHLSGKQRGRWQFKIPANRCSRMTLRINGCGHAVIHSVGRVFQLASERT